MGLFARFVIKATPALILPCRAPLPCTANAALSVYDPALI